VVDRWSGSWILSQQTFYQIFQVLGIAVRNLLVEAQIDLPFDLFFTAIGSHKGWLLGTDLIEDHPEAPNISGLIIRSSINHLGRQVQIGSSKAPQKPFGLGQVIGDPKVSQQNFLIFLQKNVRGFDIPMNNLLFMYML
jgi:hypothetical protein